MKLTELRIMRVLSMSLLPPFSRILVLLGLTLIVIQGVVVNAKLPGLCAGCNADATCFGLKNIKDDSSQYGGSCNINNDTDCGDCDAVFKFYEGLPGAYPRLTDVGVLVGFDTNKSSYAAAGISPNRLVMRNLLVFLCNKNPNDGGKLYNSVRWADGLKRPAVEPTTPVINLRTAEEFDGIATCSWDVPNKVMVNGSEFDFKEKDYYLLGAIITKECSRNIDREFCKHSKVYVTETPDKVNKIRAVSSYERKSFFYRMHACFQIVSFIGLMPIATIIARFFKETWTGTKLLGRPLWYIIHVTILLSALAFTIFGYIFALKYNEFSPFNFGGRRGRIIHASIGFTVILFFISQVVLHLVITPSHPMLLKRYQKIHAVVGGTTYFLAVINIMITKFTLAKPTAIFVITFFYILIYLSVFVGLTNLLMARDKGDHKNENDEKRALIAVPMRVIHVEEDAPGATTRYIFLAILCISGALTSVALVIEL